MVIVPQCVGTFFPADAGELRVQVDGLLGAAVGNAGGSLSRKRQEATAAKAIIVPHAGYGYSGAIAAAAYAELAGRGVAVRRVVLLGTCHVVSARGMVTTAADEIATPLGVVPVDTEAVGQAGRLPHVSVNDWAHEADHALAVQLPFLQRTLAEFRIVPFLVAECEPAEVAEVLALLWGGDETLIVVSSDLSHYLTYNEAVRHDRRTAEAIENLQPDAIGREDACGQRAIAGLLLAARAHTLHARLVDLRNSGDTSGRRDRVVGYGAFVFE
jgi:AmmeMemoRadiSam system protein B